MPEDEVLEPEELKLPPDIQAKLRIGRKAEREAQAAKAEVARMQKEVAIKDAGVPDHPAREVVFKDYEGPLDAESIKAHAERFGIVAPPPTNQGPTAEELEAQRRVLGASSGAPAPTGDVDAAVAMRNAKSPEEVMRIVSELAGTDGFRSQDGLIGVLPEL